MGKFSRDHIWVWDGPAFDLGPSIYGLGIATRYFHAENVMYLWWLNNEFALDELREFKRVVCDLTMVRWSERMVKECICLSLLGKETGTTRRLQRDEALNISKLSQKYKNITGGIIDDFVGTFIQTGGKPEDLKEIYFALKEYNPSLQLYGVIYTHEFDLPILKEYLPYIDIVNIWVWKNTENLKNLESYIARCPEVFPGKPVLLGLYLYDYPTKQPMPRDLLEFEFNKAIQYVKEEKIIGFSILGSNFIDHFPENANWVRRFLEKNLSDLSK
ncbi:MAG: hypothetical protein QXU67_03755 [Candidatus Bathyarchaeia archaeon]